MSKKDIFESFWSVVLFVSAIDVFGFFYWISSNQPIPGSDHFWIGRLTYEIINIIA